MARVLNRTTGDVVVEELRLAHTHWTRLRGLLGTRTLKGGTGLWLKPCRQVHMFGMIYAIDVIFLDRELRVVAVLKELSPNKISPKFALAESVLELPAGSIERSGLKQGMVLEIETAK